MRMQTPMKVYGAMVELKGRAVTSMHLHVPSWCCCCCCCFACMSVARSCRLHGLAAAVMVHLELSMAWHA